MYTIVRMKNGMYECRCRIQDGVEYHTCDSQEKAINWIKSAAKVMNNAKIKKRDIQFVEPIEVVVVQTKYQRYEP